MSLIDEIGEASARLGIELELLSDPEIASAIDSVEARFTAPGAGRLWDRLRAQIMVADPSGWRRERIGEVLGDEAVLLVVDDGAELRIARLGSAMHLPRLIKAVRPFVFGVLGPAEDPEWIWAFTEKDVLLGAGLLRFEWFAPLRAWHFEALEPSTSDVERLGQVDLSLGHAAEVIVVDGSLWVQVLDHEGGHIAWYSQKDRGSDLALLRALLETLGGAGPSRLGRSRPFFVAHWDYWPSVPAPISAIVRQPGFSDTRAPFTTPEELEMPAKKA